MEMTKNRTVNRTNAVHGTTFVGVAEGPKHKIVPFTLPRNLVYLVDITMPHAQLVGVDCSRIDWLISKLVPQSSPTQKQYFSDKILEAADRLLEHSNKRLEMVFTVACVTSSSCPTYRYRYLRGGGSLRALVLYIPRGLRHVEGITEWRPKKTASCLQVTWLKILVS